MSVQVVKVEAPFLRPKFERLSNEIVIGKDVLELLTGAMYVDPLNVFREYIQNAADSIDVARARKLDMPDAADVEVILDPKVRSIRIRDYGASLPNESFARVLTAIGESGKRNQHLRGFRGVGRLSGLGYCQELFFRARTSKSTKIMELRWDARALRDCLRSPSFAGGLAELVREIATTTELSGEGQPERFFEVELRKVMRLRNDLLLNEDMVRRYLAAVAPVPFNPQTKFGARIAAELENRGIAKPIRIQLNDTKGLVHHPLEDEIPIKQKLSDRFRGIDIWTIAGTDGEPSAFGWVVDHAYFGAIPKRTGLGGIRLRTGNMQVGDAGILSSVFPEARFTEWAVGEIHVLSPKILPNARRDDFEPSQEYAHFQGEVAVKAKEIVQKIRARSEQRSRLARLQLRLDEANHWRKAAAKPNLSSIVRQAALSRARLCVEQGDKLVGKLTLTSDEIVAARRTLRATESDIAKALRKGKDTGTHVRNGAAAAAVDAILRSSTAPKDAIELAQRVVRAIKKA